MSFIDIIFILIIVGFTLFGLWFGFVHTLGSLLGTLLGAYLASRYYEPLASWLMGVTGWGDHVSKVVMFILAFIVINRIVGFLFWIIDRTASIVTSLPFISSINRLLGAALGALEGAITLGLILYFIERVPLSLSFMQFLADSTLAPIFVGIASVLLPLLPEALRAVKSTVDFMENSVQDFTSTSFFY